ARGQEDRRLVPEQRRHALLERDDRGVVAALFVADLCAGDRIAHLRGRPRLGVRVEIDHCRLSSMKSRHGRHTDIRAPPHPPRPPPLAAQAKGRPAGPGVYLFRDGRGKVIYVGKAKSIKKRVASHFSNPVTRGAFEMVDAIESVEFILVASEAEALLAEQNFIKQYRPRFNIRLRDDKSYPFIAISMDDEFPHVSFTRDRHR